jgi:hypothetical protein
MNYLKNAFTNKDQSGKVSVTERQVISDSKKLLKIIQQSSGKTRLKAVEDLEKLCEKPENMEILCLNEDLSLLSSLKQLLETIKDDNACLDWIFLCINWLTSGDVSCKTAVCSKELGILPIIMKTLRSSSDEYTIDTIEKAISNCSIFEGCHDYLLSSEIGWLDYLEKRLKEKPNDVNSFFMFRNFMKTMRNENVPVMINQNIPEIILQKFVTYGSNDGKWSKEDLDFLCEISEYLVFLSKSLNGTRYLKEYFIVFPQYSSFFFDLVSSSSSTTVGVVATITLANVYGRDENNDRTKALLSSHPDILPLLIDIMEAIMNWDVNRKEIKALIKKGFKYGMPLSVVSVALRNLSISDENKKIMITYPRLISLACQGIRLFIDDAPECKGMNPGQSWYDRGGGGGNDFVTVENLLELLLQFSFMFDNEASLKLMFVDPAYHLKLVLEQLLNLSSERKVTFEARQFAMQLLSKLDPTKRKVVGESTAVDGQHIMLSYSWSANKDLVVAFGKKLKEMGYDVWRDEEGSSILSPMSMTGNTLDAMTAAVEKSYMMIIFVSPEYKESTNCRIEGLYGFKRAASRGLKLVYVMMNQNFTTESRPVVVDGWLAGMIGAELWYPLWDRNQVNSTSSDIAAKIGNNAKRVMNVPFSLTSSIFTTPSSPVSPVSPVTVSTPYVGSQSDTLRMALEMKLDQEANFIAAFEFLQKEKSICPDLFVPFLNCLNISDPEDLKFADMTTVVTLSGLLKQRFRQPFLSSLRL